MFSPANNWSSAVFKMLLACSLNTFSSLSQYSVYLVGLGARHLQRDQAAVSSHYSICLPFLQSIHVLGVRESPTQRTEFAFRMGSFCNLFSGGQGLFPPQYCQCHSCPAFSHSSPISPVLLAALHSLFLSVAFS